MAVEDGKPKTENGNWKIEIGEWPLMHRLMGLRQTSFYFLFSSFRYLVSAT